MQEEKHVSVWFPDIKVLQEIRKEAKKTNRGIGYVICKNWRLKKEKEKQYADTN